MALSIVGGVRNPRIPSKYLARPCDGLAHSDSGWLWPCPEFEVLRPVVLAYAVPMMDGLLTQQVSAEDLFHDEYVFEDVLTLPGSRVTGCPDHHVPGLMACAAAFPAAV